MRLFLTAISQDSKRAPRSGGSPDGVALFDDGVWTRSGPSRDAVTSVSAAFVAQEVHRQAALTELVQTSKNDVVCFRYGPRPNRACDFFFFHRRRFPALEMMKVSASASAALPSSESTSVSSPLITPSSSVHSGRSGQSLLTPIEKALVPHGAASATTTAAAAAGGGNVDPAVPVYDSFLALWLLDMIVTRKADMSISACLLSVDGCAMDLVAQRDIRSPLSTHVGSTRVLRCSDDVHRFLHHCEDTIGQVMSSLAVSPYHLWVTVRVGRNDKSEQTDELPTATFLDLASLSDGAGDHNTGEAKINAAHALVLREQLQLFERQLGTSTAAANSVTPTAAVTQRWLGLLQSCQLSRANKIGIFCLAPTSSSSPFEVSTEAMGCDPFQVSAALRQRALEDAVNFGLLHPHSSHSSSSSSRRRARQQHQKKTKEKSKKKKDTTTVVSPTLTPTKSATPSSMFITPTVDTASKSSNIHHCSNNNNINNSPQLPSLLRATLSSKTLRSALMPADASPSARSIGQHTARIIDLFALLDAEEYVGRTALVDSESRARDLAWMRWVLRAHPPNTSVTAVARQLTSAVERLSRQKVRSAPLKRPPPLTEIDLAATTRTPSNSAKTPSSSKSQSTSKHSQRAHPRSAKSTDVVREVLPIITSPAQEQRTASSGHPSAATPSRRRPPAAAAQLLHPEFLMAADTTSHPPSAGVSPQFSVSPCRRPTSGGRRYSALEVALLERAHSATRRSSTTVPSPQNGGDVELLYPLVRTFHAELTAQDAVMAEELMARSRIELRELNRRRTIENRRAEATRTPKTAPSPTAPARDVRGYSAPRRPSRMFFDA